ncbi:MAG: hypothetical protein HYY03_00305 [Chloroflexi bacterium]|nr:hypothetical protein [Chloroflexota bacterium]
MLRACRRVLRPQGRLAFYTIHIPPGLSTADYRRAVRARSPGLASWRRQQTDLLRTAGFLDIDEIDFTGEFLRISRAWLEARLRHADELRQAEGAESVDQRIRDGRAAIRAIEQGLLRRSLFVAVSP